MKFVYIVDDDDDVRASLHGLVSIRPNTLVRAFANGDRFIEAVDELEPGVALLDMHMPGASGMDVLQAIRPASHLRAIILTGQGNIGLAVQAMKLGAIDFLEKPYDSEALLDLIDVGFSRLESEDAASRRVDEAKDKLSRLSARERDVLTGLIAGRPNKVIAHELDISPRTVEIYRANLMGKLNVRSLSEALRIAFAAGLVVD
jgi:two-component system response regulator FixJ